MVNVIPAITNLTQFGSTTSVNVMRVIMSLTDSAQPLHLIQTPLLDHQHAMSQLISMINKKGAYLAQMDVYHALLAINAHSVAHNSIITQQVSSALKSAVMVRDLHLVVMMETMSMAMVAQRTVVLKVDIIVLEDLPIQKILALHLDLLL